MNEKVKAFWGEIKELKEEKRMLERDIANMRKNIKIIIRILLPMSD